MRPSDGEAGPAIQSRESCAQRVASEVGASGLTSDRSGFLRDVEAVRVCGAPQSSVGSGTAGMGRPCAWWVFRERDEIAVDLVTSCRKSAAWKVTG